VLHWHQQRSNCENHIKYLKHGFSPETLPSDIFNLNAARLRMIVLSFRQSVVLEFKDMHKRKAQRFR